MRNKLNDMRCKEKGFQKTENEPQDQKKKQCSCDRLKPRGDKAACAASGPIWDIGAKQGDCKGCEAKQCSGKGAQVVLDWLITKDRYARMIGRDILEAIVEDDPPIPSQAQFDGLIRVCDDERERINRKLICDRKEANTNVNKWDWEYSYGRRAFRAARCNYSPPTSYLAHPTITGE